jgi:D-psicose/D-tagatose/L-ribulose 3-epimerase
VKLACHASILGNRPWPEKFALLQEFGFDGVDVFGDMESVEVAEVRQLLASQPLQVGSVYGRLGSNGLLGATNRERSEGLDTLRRRIETAHTLGADAVVVVPVAGEPKFGLGLNGEAWVPLNVERMVLVALLQEILPEAEQAGVSLVLEPLNVRETHFLTDPVAGADICRAVEHPFLRTMVDTYHMDREGQDAEVKVRATAPHLKLVHLSDTDRNLPGFGSINFTPLFAALSSVSFNGWCGFEGRAPDNPQDIPTAGAFCRDGWKAAVAQSSKPA